MRNSKPTLALAAIFAVCGLFLASCGGGGGSNSSANTEVINGIAVPPEPDPVKNSATIAGVDVNNNSVRDDIERVAATNYPEKYNLIIAKAKIEYAILTFGSSSSLSNEARLVQCSKNKISDTEFFDIFYKSEAQKKIQANSEPSTQLVIDCGGI